MEARAVKRYIPTSPRKMRLVVDLVRGRSIREALSILHYSPKHASKVVEMTIKSAVSNLSNKLDSGKIEENEVFVKEIFVNGGAVMKRMLPAPQGRAYKIRKRSAHLTVVITEKQ